MRRQITSLIVAVFSSLILLAFVGAFYVIESSTTRAVTSSDHLVWRT